MKFKCTIFFLLVIVIASDIMGQGAPASGNASAAAKSEATPVNFYTGIPSISVPIYSYSHNSGINFGISLDYFAGGIKVAEAPSTVGLGWNLNLGGVITRTVRGIPDDCEGTGFLYNAAIPTDPRSGVANFNRGCDDVEQDVFQFNFAGRSGKFYIGKDTSIFIVPLSKLRIKWNRRITGGEEPIVYAEPHEQYEKNPPFPSMFGTINSFTIITEDGVKYIFEEKESDRTYITHCYPFYTSQSFLKYTSAWYLTKIISALGNDSIKISYKTRPQLRSAFSNQWVSILNGVTTHSDTTETGAYFGGNPSTNKVPQEILLPDNKKINLIYDQHGLRRIKISDSIFRYGFLLDQDSMGMVNGSFNFLKGINYYTNKALKSGYTFTYNSPFLNTVFDTAAIYNKYDHWGYYNGANNSKDCVPTIAGIYNGADRSTNGLAIARSLASVKDPSGGTTYYDFENNDRYPYESVKQYLNINASLNTQNTIAIERQLGKQTHFKIDLDLSNTSISSMPISGAGDLIIKLTNYSGTTVYSIDTVNLQELYYTGYATFYCTLPTSNYELKTMLGNGTATTINLPLKISWYNQTAVTANGIITGGIRIKQIRHYDPFYNKTDTLSTYKYLTETGKSSGFLGNKPIYDYDLITDNSALKHIIGANVIDAFDYTNGNSVGYSRVEVIKGTVAKNLGKQVYFYSNIEDDGVNNAPAENPYMNIQRKDWLWGLPKKIITYDNGGRIIQSTENNFISTNATMKNNVNFESLKIGRQLDIYRNDDISVRYKDFRTQKYFPLSGRTDLAATLDTFYHPDNSITTNVKYVTFDTNFNVIKTVMPYDKNKNLNLEKRIYYPYNYNVAGAIGHLRDSSIYIPISTETWIIGDANPRMISATATSFGNGRLNGGFSLNPNTTFSLQSNKPINQNVIGLFNPSILVRDTNYIKAQQQMVFDVQNKLRQTSNVASNVSNFIIYGYNETYIIAQVSNAKYSDVAFTSFEPNSLGTFEILNNTGAGYDSTSSITGRFSYDLTNHQIKKLGLNELITYQITYWTKGTVYVSSSGNATLIEQRNGWNLYSQTVSNVTEIIVFGNGLIDELRLYPKDANMTTSCYGPIGEVTSICDANNNIVYYEYDIINRLKLVRDKDKNIVKKYDYSDTYSTINQSPNWTFSYADSLNSWQCERDSLGRNNGNVLRFETDINPYSESSQETRYVFDHVDFGRCPYSIAQCGDNPAVTSIAGTCETGQKITTSSVYKKALLPSGNYGFTWVCTYHYRWSDGSVSPDYTEQSSVSCPISSNGI